MANIFIKIENNKEKIHKSSQISLENSSMKIFSKHSGIVICAYTSIALRTSFFLKANDARSANDSAAK